MLQNLTEKEWLKARRGHKANELLSWMKVLSCLNSNEREEVECEVKGAKGY